MDSGGVGSFAADVAGLGAVKERGFEGERRGASGAGFTRAAIFMLGGGDAIARCRGPYKDMWT